MFGVWARTKNPILHRVEAGIKKRARVRPGTQIPTNPYPALGIDVAAKSEVGGATEGLIVRRGKAKAFGS
jgi:hypothetical protein